MKKDDIKAKRTFHDFSLKRMRAWWFWKGQVLCRLFGHRIPTRINQPWCGRCGIALEEIYGLNFYEHYDITPQHSTESELTKLRKAIVICRDINDSGETYNSPTADAAQALANLFSLVDDWKEKDFILGEQR